MKPRTLVIFDMSCIFYASYYAGQNLSYNGLPTGLIFKSIHSVLATLRRHRAQHYLLAFDRPPYRRNDTLQSYKQNRPKVDSDFGAQADSLGQLLRTSTRAVLEAPGFEADDVIAVAVAEQSANYDEIIIYSVDSDLFQLISETASVVSPRTKKVMDLATFRQTYSAEPSEWAQIKAITGDGSDNIPGLDGIKTLTAVKYLRGRASAAVVQRIDAAEAQIRRNLSLIQLPTAPLQLSYAFDYAFDATTLSEYLTVYGFQSLLEKFGAVLDTFNCVKR